ncbi:universal stress protein [Corynebacterium frankenforstense]|uniref:universal stress protein n=1 Tax=Corynebacterium TaxID=1716 RepID=UPI00254A0844|nr:MULTISPECIES: universal stress protein [Corynebacterium]MDK6259623.1 universal stress protein [Corynebacterium frankenforstense]MDK8894821.1 universal stress protein [Corynebacterium sp. MSK006]
MTNPPRIMVAYIATGGGIDALRLATTLAKNSGAAIDIVMVATEGEVAPGIYPHDHGYSGLVEEQMGRWLAEAAAEVPADIEVTGHIVVGGSVATALIDKAGELNAQTIVVGSQGGGMFKRLTLGSVVNSLLHASPVPVALAPKGYNHPGPVERITVMFGPKPGATDIVEVGLRHSTDLGVPVRFVSLAITGEKSTGTDAVAALRTTAGDRPARRAAELIFTGRATAEVIEAPNVESAVGRLDWSAGDVVYMGSARLAPEGRLFLGSTATQILRHTPAPAIAVPNGYTTGAHE